MSQDHGRSVFLMEPTLVLLSTDQGLIRVSTSQEEACPGVGLQSIAEGWDTFQ